ncbi:MAG: prenyltransferase/squalene oxidase repeat-containing protein [Verrucomicrobiota bacterium]
MRTWRRTVAGWALLGCMALAAGGQDVSDRMVKQRIRFLQDQLIQEMMNGAPQRAGRYMVGYTSLVLLALKHSGLPNDHPAVRKGVDTLVNNITEETYSEGLVPSALELVDPVRYRNRIQAAVDYLVQSQCTDGSWSYRMDGNRRARGDHSNTQFAALGLGAAERAGLNVPLETRRSAADYWNASITPKGGWGYTWQQGDTMQMTCAGLASLYLLGEDLEEPRIQCGEYRYHTNLNRAMESLGNMLQQGGGLRSHVYYSLYALERVGIFYDLKKIQGLDWYRFGVKYLMNRPSRKLEEMAFELLFLAKGHAPIAIAKWEWDGDWNVQHSDVAHWIELGNNVLKTKLDWITAPLDKPDSDAAKASLIFLNGKEPFKASVKEMQFLRAFLKEDGVVVAEGACDDALFIKSFRDEMLRKLYPEQELRFVKIQDDHPICHSHFKMNPKEVSAWELRGGCSRKKVILLYREISSVLDGRPRPAAEVKRAKKVAINLLNWAIGINPPEKKLDKEELTLDGKNFVRLEPIVEPIDVKGANLRQPIGRLKFKEEYPVCTGFYTRMNKLLAPLDHLPQFDGEIEMEPSDPELFQCAVLFAAGSRLPQLSAEEQLNLKTYI